MAVPVEVLFHGRVARQLEYPARGTEGINSVTGENEVGFPERLVQDGEVAARGGNAFAQILRWSCAEFNLAAWLQGQQAGSGQRARFFKAIKNFTNPAEWHDQRGIGRVADQPFKLGTDSTGWTGLETYRPN